MRIWETKVSGSARAGGAAFCALMTAVCVLTAGVLPAVAQEAAATAQETAPAAPETAPAAPAAEKPAADVPGDLSLEQMFADYLHFARMGSFAKAEAYATGLLARPDCKPEALLPLADKYRNSRETLQIIIGNSTIGASAEKILKLIREGENLNRKSADQITGAMELLRGTPTEQSIGLDRLRYAGEYAIRWMVAWLGDPGKKDLHPLIERALPKIGKSAVNPLVIALRVEQATVRQAIADALGELGYPQAVPYLKRIADDAGQTDDVRRSAARAIAKILAANPGVADLPASEALLGLAELYYADTASLRPDEREARPNVWYFWKGELVNVMVPRQIFMDVMCMRCCEESLAVQPGQPKAVALWSAANFRREARLGMDVQSVEPDPQGLADATRREDYPRSLYFARCFGPRAAMLTLMRGVKDRDAAVTLGAVTALDGIAAANELIGSEDARQAMTQTLNFSDIRVRINAALTLARSRPPQDFAGAAQVVPILASALDLRAQPVVVIVDPNADSRRLLEELATKNNARAIAAAKLAEAATRAHREATHVDLVLLATDMDGPNVVTAVSELRRDNLLELAPAVIVVKPGGIGSAIQATTADPRIERLTLPAAGGLSGEQLTAVSEAFGRAWTRGRASYGQRPISDDEALRLSLAAADALGLIAISGTSVFQFAAAEDALIRACEHPNESMQLKAAGVLVLSANPAAQAAIAKLALNPKGPEPHRIAAMAILAASARRNGNRLPTELVDAVRKQSLHDASLPMRTAASQALGALNVEGNLAAEILRQQSRD